MKRIFRLSLWATLMTVLAVSYGYAQPGQVQVSGRIHPSDVRIFVKDSVYVINKEYIVGGTLIIEPGTQVKFNAQGRLIDSTGGRIIADGFAEATYNSRPNSYNPKATPGSAQNPYSWTGYASMDYFDFRGGISDPEPTINVRTVRDLTINTNKENYINNVVLDKAQRKIKNLIVDANGMPMVYDNSGNLVALNANQSIISFERAIIFITSRLYGDQWTKDPLIDINPWKRLGSKSSDFSKSKISFLGQQENNITREWGHIVILPGARAAFFRNVEFDGFRKDTTVDKANYYSTNQGGGTPAQWTALNQKLISLTTGGGGAITTFSSRTWLIDAEFSNNQARYHGGAIQILETPMGFPTTISSLSNLRTTISAKVGGSGNYPLMKNPAITNYDGTASSVLAEKPIPQIDMIDEAIAVEPLTDAQRAAFDDGRIAGYLGRIRNLRFENNQTITANIAYITIPNTTIKIVDFDTVNAADYPQMYNESYGGAIYIAGAEGSENRKMEFGLGVNNGINVDANNNGVYEDSEYRMFPVEDYLYATNNQALNMQKSGSSAGSKGGAIYLGRYSSLVVAGHFESNTAETPKFKLENDGSRKGIIVEKYSRGGAIFQENTYGRLQLRGGPGRDEIVDFNGTTISNPTRFIGNRAGAGGAIYVDGNTDPGMSPIIGGSDKTINTRDFGFNIAFNNNEAYAFGGAIYTKRNTRVQGAGGIEVDQLLGYGGNYPVRFNNNMADFAGGAIHIEIPRAEELMPSQRTLWFGRTDFEGNTVGQNVMGVHRSDIRGGGAIYSMSADPNVVKGVNFNQNTVKNGNGGAICLVNPLSTTKRYFITDLDMIQDTNMDGIYDTYMSDNRAFTYRTKALLPLDPEAVSYAADVRMQTRFTNNSVTLDDDQDWVNSQMGTGATQIGTGIEVTTNALYGNWWVSDTEGYAVGLNGEIIYITQGGKNWVYQSNNLPGGVRLNTRLNKVRFTQSTTGYIAGNQGVLLSTTNKGANWNPVNLGTNNDLKDVYFVNTNLGFAVGTGGVVYKTTDGFNTWSMSTPIQKDLNSVYFASTSTGYIVGDDKTILRTTNAGTTWETMVTPLPNYDFTGISFVSTSKGFITGRSGILLTTTDGGSTWSQIATNTNATLTAITFTNQNVGYITVQNGTIMKTIDGGANWTEDTKSTNYNAIWDAHFSSFNTGYIVGDRGSIYKTTNAGTSWTKTVPSNAAMVDVVRYHATTAMPENGIGLGGGLYILDEQAENRIGRTDSINFNRVRFQRNNAYTGAVIYSDNYDLKLILNKSLVANNMVNSTVGYAQNAITGPVGKDANGVINQNNASSDLVGAVIYGELQGPLPSYEASISANSIYDNSARFTVRMPDAPHTKGILAGTTGIGLGGTDTLRGNWWGRTEANVNVSVTRTGSNPAVQETFFVAGDGESHLPYVFGKEGNPGNPELQGPFESTNRFSYVPVPLLNDATSENIAAAKTIPDTLLMSGKIYDLYDKGTDIKVADYSKRRMSPIEDFAVGIPSTLKTFTNPTLPSFRKYVRRMTRNPYFVDDAANYPNLAAIQDEMRPDKNGNLVHPIGYPLYLETYADYSGIVETSNHDPLSKNQTVMFVINENTGDYIRVVMNQVGEDAPYREVFRSTVELIPDSSGNRAILDRRSSDGLANFGNNTKILLENLFRDANNEDAAALLGRKYITGYNGLGNATNLFSNRPAFSDPASNVAKNQNGQVTYFGGERYGALPVNVGDKVRVISRTELWKNGVNPAYDSSLAFTVTRSTEIPLFTGDVVELSTDTIVKILPSEYPDKRYDKIMDTLKLTEFLHTVFVSEDRSYPQKSGTYSTLKTVEFPDGNIFGDDLSGYAGRDSIFTLTAVDSNNYYDPRSIAEPGKYTKLNYKTWMADGLSNWITVDTVYADAQAYDNAKGYLVFKGQPSNPYVVPGGSDVLVEAYNFPPNWRTYDQIMNSSLTDAEKQQFIETYPSYFNAEKYASVDTARFLQQDTLDVGFYNKANYNFKIFVVDSIPRYLDENYPTEEIVRFKPNSTEAQDTLVIYTASEFACAPKDGKLIANLTDKLRFQMNINTDDELEDQWARKVHNWDFRYGQTSYGFLNRVRNGGTWDDPVDVTVDTTWVLDDHGVYVSKVDQVRPMWLADTYLTRYGTDNQPDLFGQDFVSRGELNVRIPSADAYTMLTPNSGGQGNANQPLNLDTAFIIVVNDGHGGKIERKFDILINVKPTILPASLPTAEEGQDYNWELTDTTRRIKFYDPNFGQEHKYELIYVGDSRTEIKKDPCFAEAGTWDLSDKKTTPKWLKINEQSGLLYGTPGIKDAPSQDVVWVLVTDADGLTDMRSFSLTVDTATHKPKLLAIPSTKCVDREQAYSDTLIAVDYDLLRDPIKNADETLTFTVEYPADGFVVEPASYTGNGTTDSVKIIVRSNGTFDPPVDADGKIRIRVRVSDGVNSYVIEHVLNVSDVTFFTSNIKVSNAIGGFQYLQWGTAANNATTGDNTDGAELGSLDHNYCEYELPPLPSPDVFDVRWTIPTINGTLRSIYPANVSNNQIYYAQIQPGGENGQTSPMYPLKIEWDMTEVPALSDVARNPKGSVWYIRDAHSNGSLLNINMNTGEGELSTGFIGETLASKYVLTVNNTSFNSFVIWRDYNNDVEPTNFAYNNGLTSVYPNIVSTTATIKFEVNKSSKVQIDVVDILGNVVASLTDANYTPGQYSLVWSAVDNNNKELSNGNYQIRMVAGENVSVVPVNKIK